MFIEGESNNGYASARGGEEPHPDTQEKAATEALPRKFTVIY